MAKPNAKGPVRTVQIYCSKCKFQLFKYRKGGKGALVKCFKERIVEDFTHVHRHWKLLAQRWPWSSTDW